MSEWINVIEEYPSFDKRVLIHRDGFYVQIAWLSRSSMEFHDDEAGYILEVTHWMPLPEPPKEG